MRASDFLLLEYDRTKTLETFGTKILQALARDPTASPELKRQQDRQSALVQVLDRIEGNDPTEHKEYTQWLAKCYSNEAVKLEDIDSKAQEALALYHQMKRKRLFRGAYGAWGDIYKLSFRDLLKVVNTPELSQQLNREKKQRPKGKATEIFHNDQVRILEINDEAAAKYYGQGTQWCTSGDKDNRFNYYHKKGPIFVLLPQHPQYPGEKYQMHVATDQFMDPQDDPAGGDTDMGSWYLLKKRFGNILPVIQEHDPNIYLNLYLIDQVTFNRVLDKVKALAYRRVGEFRDLYGEDGLPDDWIEEYDGFLEELDRRALIGLQQELDYLDGEHRNLLDLSAMVALPILSEHYGKLGDLDNSDLARDLAQAIGHGIVIEHDGKGKFTVRLDHQYDPR